MNKIIRSICYFTNDPTKESVIQLDKLGNFLIEKGFEIQTKRICSPAIDKILDLDLKLADKSFIFGIGSIIKEQVDSILNKLLKTKDTSFNLDLTDEEITLAEVKILFELIKENPPKTFNFTYVFNNPPSSPFFPSGNYEREGFSVGLQPTDLSENCKTLEEWLEKLRLSWLEINILFKGEPKFLGIDSSVAPLFNGKSSLVSFIKRLGYDFPHSATTDAYLKITKFLFEGRKSKTCWFMWNNVSLP